MSIYLGTGGQIELLRQFDGTDLRSIVNTSDVNVTRKRLSFDFKKGQLVTGDQIEITSTNGAALSFISSYSKTSVKNILTSMELAESGFTTVLLMPSMAHRQTQLLLLFLAQMFQFVLKFKTLILECSLRSTALS